jgi:hypothetical protein
MSQLSTKLPWDLANTKWAATINPVLAIPFLDGLQIDDIILAATTPKAINHLLQRKLQGWFLMDNQANAVIWRTAAFNDLTLTLESNANTTISIWVF